MSEDKNYPHTERIFITSEMARQWMKNNIINNRPIQLNRVQQYMRDMKNGRWKENAETIKFADTGELIDGQPRLQACMEGGVGFWSLVAYGVKRDAFLTIDRGQTRTPGQQLFLMDGVGDYNAIAATLNILYRFRDGIILRGGKATATEVEELLLHNPGIADSVAAARRINRRFRAGPIPVIAICHYLFTRQDATLAEAFFDALATGASLREIDPVYQLRSRIISSSANTSKRIDSHELLALFFKTWIAEREQRTMKVALRWASAESFPNIGPVENVNKVRPEKAYHQAGQRKRKHVPPLVKEEVKPSPVKSPEPETKLDRLIAKHKGLDERRPS